MIRFRRGELEENLADLRRHAEDFTRRAGFTFTVLDPSDNDVIGCVYLYPSPSEQWDVTVQSWVRADRSGLDVPLADAVARWLATDEFRLEPLGPQHNEADHAAWMSSIEHIRSTPGYPDSSWPPGGGMSLEENLSDLRRHAGDFARGTGFTFTVLDPGDNDVIGCVYLYPSRSAEWDVKVLSWVRADRSSLDVPLADAVARWLATDWPWERVDRCGR